jgi:hypothetical protein
VDKFKAPGAESLYMQGPNPDEPLENKTFLATSFLKELKPSL